MEQKQRIELINNAGGSFQMELAEHFGEEDVSGSSYDIDEVRKQVKDVAASLSPDFSSIGADEMTVNFGVSFRIETGKLTSLIVSSSGEATIGVSLRWKKH